MERKLTGSVKLKSTVKYDVHRPSEKEKVDAVFGAEHQRVNDQRVAIMIEEIMAGMHEIYDGSIELEDNPEIVEELLKKDLGPQQTLLGLTILEVAVKKLQFKLSQMIVANTKATEKAQGTVKLPGEKNGARGVSANVSISSTIGHEIFKESKEAEQFINLQSLHSKASSAQAQHIADEVGAGNIPFDIKNGVQLDHKTQTMDLLKRLYGSVSQNDAKFADIEIHALKVKVDFESLTETEMKIWEVFFDHKDKATGKGKRIDPLILDLNRDGKFDITGANQEGNGKIDGPTVNFDIDPSKQSWRKNSPGHRPGWYEGRASHLVAAIPNGKAIYNTGKTENFGKKGVWIDNPKKGQSAKIYDASQKWVGEWVAADWGYSHGGRLGRYYFDPFDEKEETVDEPGSGDGFLVWDKNGNGIIDDNTDDVEFDIANNDSEMVEELAFYFDLTTVVWSRVKN